MNAPNPLNVFKGPDSVQYVDPSGKPLLPLVELPDSLNPLRGDGVRIFAKIMTLVPAHNLKSLPGVVNMIAPVVSLWLNHCGYSAQHAST